MEKNKKNLIRVAIFTVIMIGIVFMMRLVINATVVMGNYDDFAQCIAQKGVKFYGAFWCPHCQAQKKRFGGSAKYLPYVECSTPDAQGQTQICKDNNIKGYPTWVFPDGTHLEQEMELADLAQKTSCPLPAGTSTATSSTSSGSSSAVK